MDDNRKQLLELDAQGFTYLEIAKALRITRSAVSGRLRRIRRKTPELLIARISGKAGAATPAKEKKPRKVTAKKVIQTGPNWATFSYRRPTRQYPPTKAELWQQLHDAVKNTR